MGGEVTVDGGVLASMKSDMNEMKQSVAQMAQAMTRLAVVEERQSAQVQMIERALARMENLEARQHATELRIAASNSSADQLMQLRRDMDTLQDKISGYEGGGKAVVGAAKFFWGIFGGAIGAGLIWLMSNFAPQPTAQHPAAMPPQTVIVPAQPGPKLQ